MKPQNIIPTAPRATARPVDPCSCFVARARMVCHFCVSGVAVRVAAPDPGGSGRPDPDRLPLRPARLDDDVAADYSGTDRPAGVDYLSLVGAVLRPHPVRCAADRDGDWPAAAENTVILER